MQGAFDVKMPEDVHGQRGNRGEQLPVRQGRNAQRHARAAHGNDADDHAARHAQGEQRAGQEYAGNGQQCLRRAKIAQSYKRGRVRSDDAAVLHADKGNESAYAHNDGVFEIHGHGVDNHLPYPGHGKGQKNHTGNKHGAEACLPVIPRRPADVVGKEGADAEAGRDGHGEARPEAHQQGGENCHPYCCRHGGLSGHAPVRQHARNHENQVTHGHKTGQAGQKFPTHVGAAFSKMEHAVNKGNGHVGSSFHTLEFLYATTRRDDKGNTKARGIPGKAGCAARRPRALSPRPGASFPA